LVVDDGIDDDGFKERNEAYMVEKLVPNEDIVFLIDGKVMQMRQSIQNLCFLRKVSYKIMVRSTSKQGVHCYVFTEVCRQKKRQKMDMCGNPSRIWETPADA